MPESTRKGKTTRPQLPTRTSGPLNVRTATLRVDGSATGRAYPTERRNLASRQALLRRITVEYDEMPGLRLTVAQADRLFGLREDVCTRVLHALVDVAILRRDGSYARDGVRP